MSKFRKKPVVIEAIQFVGANRDAVVTFGGGVIVGNYIHDSRS